MPISSSLFGRQHSVALLATSTISLGLVYGYDSSIIGGTLFMLERHFRLDIHDKELLTSAAVVGQLIGALGGSWFIERMGRKKATMSLAIGFALFSLFSACATTFHTLMTARFLVGLAIGLSIVVVPVFVAESAPTARRGAILASYQVACVAGIIMGYLSARIVSHDSNWRLVLALAIVPSLLAALFLSALVEPPQSSRHVIPLMTRFREIVRPPFTRAFFFVLGIGVFAQLTGINAVVYYGPVIFTSMGFDENGALTVSAWVQVASLVSVIVAMSIVDRLGRRPVLLTGIAVMALSCLVLAVLFTQKSSPSSVFSPAQAFVGFAAIAAFTMGFTFGFGVVIWAYAGESFPARLRSLGSSTLLTADLAANVVISWQFLTVLNAVGGSMTFFLLAAISLTAFAFVWRLAPETKGKDIEDIERYWANGGRW